MPIHTSKAIESPSDGAATSDGMRLALFEMLSFEIVLDCSMTPNTIEKVAHVSSEIRW